MQASEHLLVGDVARVTGKTVRTIHYYEELGLLTPCRRTEGRFRIYGPDTPHRVELIGQLKDLGFSLEQIGEIIKTWRQATRDEDASARLRGILTLARGEAVKKISTLQQLERQIAGSLERLDRGEPQDQPAIFIDAIHSGTR